MKCILGFKKEMTQIFQEDGTCVAVTIIDVPKCCYTAVKNIEKDGYVAVQLASGHNKHISKPQKGQFKEMGDFRFVKEFRGFTEEDLAAIKVGDTVPVSAFEIGQKVSVTAKSKGKGFQGVVKMHHFHGSPKTHGHKDQLRKSGSVGDTGAQNVKKGKRMAGRMGGEQITLKNLEVVKIDQENAQLYIKGAVPGARHTLVAIRAE